MTTDNRGNVVTLAELAERDRALQAKCQKRKTFIQHGVSALEFFDGAELVDVDGKGVHVTSVTHAGGEFVLELADGKKLTLREKSIEAK